MKRNSQNSEKIAIKKSRAAKIAEGTGASASSRSIGLSLYHAMNEVPTSIDKLTRVQHTANPAVEVSGTHNDKRSN